ncbi:MAG: hypothetical protein Q4D81_13035 [Eubacteriales bacterium]|nr:hypothetical protein [Eubacteriales bacterium]
MKTSLKHRILQQFVCLAMAVIICSGFIPLRAEASTKYVYKITTLKQNTYVTAKGDKSDYNDKTDSYTDTYYLYKITVPANGYVKIQTTNSSKYIYIYRSINKNEYIGHSDRIRECYDSKIYYQALPKGTYYIYADSGTKFKWSFVKCKNPSNYCRSRAATLAAGKKTTIVINPGYEYDRWYKVVLKKKKTITVTIKILDDNYRSDFYLYDSKGSRVNCPYLTTDSYRTAILPKGKYYIRILAIDKYSDAYGDFTGRISQLMWK